MSDAWKIDLTLVSAALLASFVVLGADLSFSDVLRLLAELI